MLIKNIIMSLDSYFNDKDQLKDLMNHQEEALITMLIQDITDYITSEKLSTEEIKDLFKDTKSYYFETNREMEI